MGFDPLDHTTWYDDPEDFTIPPHKDAHIPNVVRQSEEADGALSDIDPGVQREALKQLRREQGNTGMEQVTQGQEALSDALQALDDSEAALRLTDEEITDELHRRDPIWWAAIEEARRVYRKYLGKEDRHV